MTLPRNTIRTFALVCVAITSLFVMAMIIWSTVMLAQSDWCTRAVGAVNDAPGFPRPEYAVVGCFQLLNEQLRSLSFNSHIYAGVIGLCLLVLMVIVVAGGRLSFKGPGGIEANMGRTDDAPKTPAAAAQQTADAAQETADEIGAENVEYKL